MGSAQAPERAPAPSYLHGCAGRSSAQAPQCPPGPSYLHGCGGRRRTQPFQTMTYKGTCSACGGTGQVGWWNKSLCLSCDGWGQTLHYKLYHGTSLDSADRIQRYGFKISQDGMFGPGVYVTGDLEKAVLFARNRGNGSGAILTLDVDVGKCKCHDATGCTRKHRPGCMCRSWLEDGYDSQYVAQGEGLKREETVVARPEQISVMDVQRV